MAEVVSAQPTALLDVRLLPWRPRLRVMKPKDLRRDSVDLADPLTMMVEGGVMGLAFAIGFIVLAIVAAPIMVWVLAGLLFSFELPLLVLLLVVFPGARFLGLLPWTILVLDPVRGAETTEQRRLLWRATRRIREINHDRRVRVRWAWA